MNVSEIRFEWDEAKNLANRRKHGIRFGEASHVFFDPLHVVVDDRVIEGEQTALAGPWNGQAKHW
jgi:uncharacterized DUF497 family protein